MKKYLVVICIGLFSFTSDKTPKGWTKIETTKISGEKFEVYFFDYMTRVEKLQPDFTKFKGRQFIKILQNVQSQFPAYVARSKVKNEDSMLYFILRPNLNKMDRSNFYDLEIVKLRLGFTLDSLENKDNYKDQLKKVIDAVACRGSLVNEYNILIQNSADKKKYIGNGIEITDSIYTRVLPYEESKKPFFKLIEANL